MKNILILGAGYANMALIKSLPQSILLNTKITLISQTKYHYISVLLHEVVSGSNVNNIVFNLYDILPNGIEFIEDNVKEIKEGYIVCDKNEYKYDILVVGLGFSSDSFGIKGVREFAYPIINYDSAVKLYNRIKHKIDASDNREFNIIVCGGGFSGIELISSLADNMINLCKDSKIDYKNVRLTCVEAMPNILPMFSDDLVFSAVKYLSNLGVNIEVGAKITECGKDYIIFDKNGEKCNIKADIIIWTAGVKGNEVIENSKFFTSFRSKIEVNEFLQPINQENQDAMDNIFVIGDCAAFKDTLSNRFYPPTAQISLQMGKFLSKILVSKFKNEATIDKFVFQTKGTICSLGSNYAIGNVYNKNIKGKFALYLKQLIESKWRWTLSGLKGVLNIR